MPIRIYKRGSVYHYRGTVNGRRLRGSCKTEDKAIAQRIAAELEARQWRGHLDGPEAVLTFAQAAILYRGEKGATRYLDRVEDYWRDIPVRQITAGAIRAACSKIYPTNGPASWNRAVITPTQSVINYSAGLNLCQTIRVRRFPVEAKIKTPVTWEWVQAFTSSASPNLGAAAIFMFFTGARISEALGLKWVDIQFTERRAMVRQTKTAMTRLAHLPTPLIAALGNIPGPREGRVFGYRSRQSAWGAWRRACDRAGIERLSFHCCRHGFATAALRAGIDVVTVAKLGGWRSAALVLRTYGHAMDDPTLTDRLIGTNLTQSWSTRRERDKKSTA